MERYHINDKGNPGACHANVGGCPYGGAQDHFYSKEEARKAFEESMSSGESLKSVGKHMKAEKVVKMEEKIDNTNYYADYNTYETSNPLKHVIAGIQTPIRDRKQDRDHDKLKDLVEEN